MQSNSISKLIVVVVMLLVSLYVAFDVFASGGNVVAQFYRYVMVAGALIGLLNPRSAFFLLLALTAYLDFAKRLMIFDSGVSKFDLYFVLGVSPAVVCGIAANVLYGALTRGDVLRPGVGRIAVLVFIAAGGMGAVTMLGSVNRFNALGDAVNGVVYMVLLPVVPCLFRTPEEIRGLFRTAVVIYIPAILYMLVHWFRGSILGINPPIFGWELDYVKSGMTIEIRQLAEKVFRPFGTFNSAHNASVVFGLFFGLLCAGFWEKAFEGRRGGLPAFLRFSLLIGLLLAIYVTFSRTGWVLAVVFLFSMVMFRNRLATGAAYFVGLVSLSTVVLAAPFLLKHKVLNEWTEDLAAGRSAEWRMASKLATFNDRLEGFVALQKSDKIWTPFGFRFAYANPDSVRDSIYVHDAFSATLMKVGYVPLFAGGLFVCVLLWRMHSFVFREPDPMVRSLAATCLAGGLVLSLGALANSAQFITYPTNFWIWFMFSAVVSLMIWRKENPVLMRDGVRTPVRVGGRQIGSVALSQ